MEMDRLSTLPDHLLIHILSRLGLKQAAKTSLLSKRWRFVWTDFPSLEFYEKTGQIERVNSFKACVHGALANRRVPSLELLFLSFSYKDYMASDVDLWVELAAKNKVEHLHLNLRYRTRIAEHYTLHQSMYSNSSLKQLSLYSCAMAPPTTVEWRSMTEISLSHCILPQQVIHQIISGCPALSGLGIYRCSKFNRLEIGGLSFRSLDIEFDEDGLLEISAPYMRNLNVEISPRRGSLRLENVVSLEKVELGLRLDDEDSAPSLQMMTNAYQIFQNIRGVSCLLLRDRSLKFLSMMGMNGWELPQFKVEYMKICVDNDVFGIHGTRLILESFPFLKTFTIYGCPHGKVGTNWNQTTRWDFNRDLLHLKTINIDVFVDLELSCKSSFALAKILLERAPVLEVMKINLFMKYWYTPQPACNDFIKNIETLFSHKKSSHEATLVFSKS